MALWLKAGGKRSRPSRVERLLTLLTRGQSGFLFAEANRKARTGPDAAGFPGTRQGERAWTTCSDAEPGKTETLQIGDELQDN